MPVTKSQLSKELNLKLENGNFTINCDSDAFQSQFTSFELLPGQNTAIGTVEEVEKIFEHVLANLKRVVEIYQKKKEQVSRIVDVSLFSNAI